jgi:hypothetical protein
MRNPLQWAFAFLLLMTLVGYTIFAFAAFPYAEYRMAQVGEHEYQQIRIVNPGPEDYYCWITFSDGNYHAGILRDNDESLWYWVELVEMWGCE